MNLKFRTLKADEIDCRVNQIDQDWCSLLLYKDARCDMNILDETVGPLNWKREHVRDNANCIVSIFDDTKEEWVSKEDTGKESMNEAEKGLASDSFKRACVNWGIGRELYSSPTIFVNALNDEEFYKNNKGKYTTKTKFYVDSITYDENRNIKDLVIKDKKGNVRFKHPKTKSTPDAEKELILIYMTKVDKLVIETDTNYEELLRYFKVKSNKEMNLKQLKEAVAILEKKKEKNKEEAF